MLGIWPLSLCFGLGCCSNIPGSERQTLNAALLLVSGNQHLDGEQFRHRSPRDPLSSFFHPSLSQHHCGSCLERTQMMVSASLVGCASGVVEPQHPSGVLHVAASLAQDTPEMRPPRGASPAAGEARTRGSVRAMQQGAISFISPTAIRREGLGAV